MFLPQHPSLFIARKILLKKIIHLEKVFKIFSSRTLNRAGLTVLFQLFKIVEVQKTKKGSDFDNDFNSLFFNSFFGIFLRVIFSLCSSFTSAALIRNEKSENWYTHAFGLNEDFVCCSYGNARFL